MLGVAAAINPVRLATAVDVLHERTIVAHYHDDGVVGDAKPVDFVQDFTEAEIVKQDVDDVGWPATVPFADFGQFGLFPLPRCPTRYSSLTGVSCLSLAPLGT